MTGPGAREGRAADEVRHYIGGGYYLLIGQSVELGCDDWSDDEGVYLQHMTVEDGRIMAAALAQRPAPQPDREGVRS